MLRELSRDVAAHREALAGRPINGQGRDYFSDRLDGMIARLPDVTLVEVMSRD